MDAPLSQDVARLLRSELAARQVDLTQFADAVGQPKTTVWRKVTGKSKMTVDDVEAFAAGLGWTLPQLLSQVRTRPTLPHEEQADRAIAGMSPGEAAKVRKAAARVRPPRKPQEPDAGVG